MKSDVTNHYKQAIVPRFPIRNENHYGRMIEDQIHKERKGQLM
jgi:hypothetical protein